MVEQSHSPYKIHPPWLAYFICHLTMTRPGCEGLPPEIKGGLKNLPCSPFIDIIYIYVYIYNIYMIFPAINLHLAGGFSGSPLTTRGYLYLLDLCQKGPFNIVGTPKSCTNEKIKKHLQQIQLSLPRSRDAGSIFLRGVNVQYVQWLQKREYCQEQQPEPWL